MARPRAGHAAPDRPERLETAPTTAAQLRGDEAELYRRNHWTLVRVVARLISAPDELFEDACQAAWVILLHRQPERSAIFAWLRVVAVHEAYRLWRAEQGVGYLEDLDAVDGWEAVIPAPMTIDDLVEVHQTLELLAELPERQRDDLALLVAGFSYRESAELTGGRTFTNVSRRAGVGLVMRVRVGAESEPESQTVRKGVARGSLRAAVENRFAGGWGAVAVELGEVVGQHH